MGCTVRGALYARGPRGQRALAQLPRWFAAWERRLSRFRVDSELSRLNASGGRPVRVSHCLRSVIAAALEAAAETGGLVTPTVLAAVEAAGYDRPFDDLPPERPETPGGAMPPAAASAIRLERKTGTVQLPSGARLDVGGVAKGWAADRAVARLSHAGPALVDAGGDIAVSGPPRGNAGWPVAVADPAIPDAELDLLCLTHGGVATSVRDYRRWRLGGSWQHHVIDPRTGAPAATDVVSATVVAPSAAAAEAAAKAALILGSRQGPQWLEARPTLAGLLVCEDGEVRRSSRWAQHLWT